MKYESYPWGPNEFNTGHIYFPRIFINCTLGKHFIFHSHEHSIRHAYLFTPFVNNNYVQCSDVVNVIFCNKVYCLLALLNFLPLPKFIKERY